MTSLASSLTAVDRYERSLKKDSRSSLFDQHIGKRETRRPSSSLSLIKSASEHAGTRQKTATPSGPPGPGGPGAPNDLYQPKSLKFWLILVSNFLAMFLVALDRTIVATAIPQITDDFHSLGDIGWYGSAYMLTTAASQLVFGRLYKFYHMKWSDMSLVPWNKTNYEPKLMYNT